MTAPAAGSPDSEARHGLGRVEFIILISMVTATIAMSIDTVLPAYEEMEQFFGLGDGTRNISLTITVFLFGLGAGTIFYGPLTDRFGRKPIMYLGLSVFIGGAVFATIASTFTMFLIGRFIWGVGAAGPRIVALAITRDSYEGDLMARIMSFSFAVFLIVPILAPSMGAVLLRFGSWRWTTGIAAVMAGFIAVWFGRMHETLPASERQSLRVGHLFSAARKVATTRTTAALTLASIFAYGAFFPWLGSSFTMISRIYGREDSFALWFGLNAVLMAIAVLTTERLVNRFSAYPVLLGWTFIGLAVAGVFVVVASANDGVPPFLVFFAMVSVITAANTCSSPLMSSISMGPMGDIAGTASSVIGVLLFIVGAWLGAQIDARIVDTVTPFGVGFLAFTLVSMVGVIAGRPEPHKTEEAVLVQA